MKSKKVLITILFLGLFAMSMNFKVNANANFSFEYDEEVNRVFNGIEHKQGKGSLSYNGIKTKQHVNILDFNNHINSDVNFVMVDASEDFGWGKANLAQMIERYQEENPHLEVLAGINAGYFHIASGTPITTFIRDYEVYRSVPNNVFLTFRENGSVSYESPKLLGNEVIVFNKDNEIKGRFLVDSYNKESDKGISVLFDSYTKEIKNSDAILVKANKITDDFGRGYIEKISNVDKVLEKSFVVTGLKDKVSYEIGDKIVFQAKYENFEDVRGALGIYDSPSRNSLLVEEGKANPDAQFGSPTARNNRIAIGIRRNGGVFAVGFDGRDEPGGRTGVALNELGAFMEDQGAWMSYNLDGGGSVTMMIKNTETNEFELLNKPGDGSLRPLVNAILVVRGDLAKKPLDISDVERTDYLPAPTNLYIDEEGYINFDHVEGARGYLLNVDGKEYEVYKNRIKLNLIENKDYDIKVRALGNTTYMSSKYSNDAILRIRDERIESILNLVKNFVKNS